MTCISSIKTSCSCLCGMSVYQLQTTGQYIPQGEKKLPAAKYAYFYCAFSDYDAKKQEDGLENR